MRMVADCREQPSETNCSMVFAGEEEELVQACVEHAVSVHGHTEDEELRAQVRASLREEASYTGTGFVQLIELHTDRIEEIQKIDQEWEAEIGGERTVIRDLLTKDRDRPDTYVAVVEFPSHAQAMKNSDHPVTDKYASQIRALCEDEPLFRNLETVSERSA